MSKLRISFIGTGNMAGAIIKGLGQTQRDQVEMHLFDLATEKATALAELTGAQVCKDLAEAVEKGEIIVLAVKPQVMPNVLKDVAPLVLNAKERKVVATVAAGVELKVYEDAMPGVAVCRIMPNTSAAVLSAISGLMAGKHLLESDKANIESIFNAIGESLWIDEKDIHALIAVSGSGPAYFYIFTEMMAMVGEKLGLPQEISEKLARHTAIGAGKMLAEKTESAEELRIQVTSPGGTTAEAIKVFQAELPEVMEHAMTACANRSEEMAK